MRFAFADPPYPGQSAKHYADHSDYAGEVDHAELVERLGGYDGWVLHTSSTALRDVLALCPPDTRVMAWVKPFASFKPNVNPGYCWEPVLVHGGRRYTREDATIRDWCAEPITLRRGLAGAKPEAVCHWLFRVLNARADDQMDDLFPGSGAVTRAWESFTRQLTLAVA